MVQGTAEVRRLMPWRESLRIEWGRPVDHAVRCQWLDGEVFESVPRPRVGAAGLKSGEERCYCMHQV